MVFSMFDKHMKHLRHQIKRAKKALLHFKPQKWRLSHPETRYLGFLITEEGVRPEPKTPKALREFLVPKNVRPVKCFVEIGSYYRQFIRNFARVSEPLQDLTHKKKQFYWDPNEKQAFDAIKNAIAEIA